MDIVAFLNDYNIIYQTTGHKHCRPGWVNLPCPFCTGNPGYHLGITINGKRSKCWRCGGKSIPYVISKLASVSINQANTIIVQYKGTATPLPDTPVKPKQEFKLPTNITPLKPKHHQYIQSRGFNSVSIERKWGIVSVGINGKLDHINYQHRILAPIIWDGEIVSFQTRAARAVEKHQLSYIACPKHRELIEHQTIVYANRDINWGKPVIIVEGITDVWRFGKQAVATFGIDFTLYQVRALVKKKREAGDNRYIVIYDDEPQAVQKAEELLGQLWFRGMKAYRIPIAGDPGGLSQIEANKILRQIREDSKIKLPEKLDTCSY